jgi:hypothetical protein
LGKYLNGWLNQFFGLKKGTTDIIWFGMIILKIEGPAVECNDWANRANKRTECQQPTWYYANGLSSPMTIEEDAHQSIVSDLDDGICGGH